jgi:hypothetical protein
MEHILSALMLKQAHKLHLLSRFTMLVKPALSFTVTLERVTVPTLRDVLIKTDAT